MTRPDNQAPAPRTDTNQKYPTVSSSHPDCHLERLLVGGHLNCLYRIFQPKPVRNQPVHSDLPALQKLEGDIERPTSGTLDPDFIDHHLGQVRPRQPCKGRFEHQGPGWFRHPQAAVESFLTPRAVHHNVKSPLCSIPDQFARDPSLHKGAERRLATPKASHAASGGFQCLGNENPQLSRANDGDAVRPLHVHLLEDLAGGSQRLSKHCLIVREGVRHRVQIDHRYSGILGEYSVSLEDSQSSPLGVLSTLVVVSASAPFWHTIDLANDAHAHLNVL
mmetsp:Transcript_24648/g.57162  ORF Transcript_24648/g.57162 Transcript_24648/m.57162 type:complete len:277 (-) Transcript_24648:213-1043(-)|eukprot:CAMPEP_0114119972 /NCGR_PEP_ID=MMETSP0043_2-20121206/6398_1 /TAXON_ID=464988 /ORGANISM="Hemiselmis andersenii, Strain CCMP644" /LENGTH=276 /DNA_ID=CAMNT_0001212559 /DNA_START=43 /DNA_END=873 /DNA_ORIENTATION=-